MKKTIAAAAAALAWASTAATALGAGPATDFYVGAGAGAAHFDQDFGADVRSAYAGSPFTVTSASMTDKSGTTGIVYGGWQFHPNVAVEAAYADLGEARAAYALDRQGPFTRDAEHKAKAASVSLVGSVAVGTGFTLLAKGGVAWTKLEYRESGDDRGDPHSFTAADENQTRGTAGLGATYAITPNVMLRAQWDRYFGVGKTFALTAEGNGRFDAIDAIWVGVQYRF